MYSLGLLSLILFKIFLRLILPLTENISAKCFGGPCEEAPPLSCQAETVSDIYFYSETFD